MTDPNDITETTYRTELPGGYVVITETIGVARDLSRTRVLDPDGAVVDAWGPCHVRNDRFTHGRVSSLWCDPEANLARRAENAWKRASARESQAAALAIAETCAALARDGACPLCSMRARTEGTTHEAFCQVGVYEAACAMVP